MNKTKMKSIVATSITTPSAGSLPKMKIVRYQDSSFTDEKQSYRSRHFLPERDYQRHLSRYPGVKRRHPISRSTSSTDKKRCCVSHQSTTSESDSQTAKDEDRFERRKKKSMQQARSKCLPMNLTVEDIQQGLFRERLKAGASMADIDPMSLDRSTNFTSVGGLAEHIISML